MLISNLVKGQVTQTLAKVLFERAGYRVVRLGIEELFQEITHLSREQYLKLELPASLRFLPDLLVSDIALDKAFLVEVKFRCSLTNDSLKALHAKISEQKQYWPEMYTLLLTSATRREDSAFHQDFIRVLGPNDLDSLVRKSVFEYSHPKNLGANIWKKLPMLHQVFSNFDWNNKNPSISDVDFIATALRDLKALSE